MKIENMPINTVPTDIQLPYLNYGSTKRASRQYIRTGRAKDLNKLSFDNSDTNLE